MKYEILNERDVPATSAPMTKGMRESIAILGQLKKGSVAAITPDESETLRGSKRRCLVRLSARVSKLPSTRLTGSYTLGSPKCLCTVT